MYPCYCAESGIMERLGLQRVWPLPPSSSTNTTCSCSSWSKPPPAQDSPALPPEVILMSCTCYLLSRLMNTSLLEATYQYKFSATWDNRHVTQNLQFTSMCETIITLNTLMSCTCYLLSRLIIKATSKKQFRKWYPRYTTITNKMKNSQCHCHLEDNSTTCAVGQHRTDNEVSSLMDGGQAVVVGPSWRRSGQIYTQHRLVSFGRTVVNFILTETRNKYKLRTCTTWRKPTEVRGGRGEGFL